MADEVHVWQADLGCPDRREAQAAGRRALRLVLARYLGRDPEEIELSAGKNGKPALGGPRPALRFNLSHSGSVALVAVTPELEVGVDVERVDPGRDVLRLAEFGLEPEEAAAVRAAPAWERAAAFHAAWVRKEAVVKCLGAGLGAPLPGGPVSVAGLTAPAGYAAAVAVAGPAQPQVRRFVLPAPG